MSRSEKQLRFSWIPFFYCLHLHANQSCILLPLHTSRLQDKWLFATAGHYAPRATTDSPIATYQGRFFPLIGQKADLLRRRHYYVLAIIPSIGKPRILLPLTTPHAYSPFNILGSWKPNNTISKTAFTDMVTKRSDWGGMDVDGHRGGKVGLSVLDFDLRLWQTEQCRTHSNSLLVIPGY